MKISELIAKVKGLYANIFTDDNFLDWINELEDKLYTNYIKKKTELPINIVANQASYAMVGYNFQDILTVKVNGQEYRKRDTENYEDTIESFYESGGLLKLYPVPIEAAVDGLKVIYLGRPVKKTKALMAIQELELPEKFASLYQNYLISQICLYNREFEEYNNWTNLYNKDLSDFLKWYWKGNPLNSAVKNQKRWGR